MKSKLFLLTFILASNAMCCVGQRAEDFPKVDQLPSIYELPDPLVMMDGTPVTTKDMWYKDRRPEIKALFQHYMYGYMPPDPGITATLKNSDKTLFDGKATLKEVEISLDGPNDYFPPIRLALFVPNNVENEVPVFLGINKWGNHTTVGHSSVTIDPNAWRYGDRREFFSKEESRGSRASFWSVENTIDRGYAFATFHESNIVPDTPDSTARIHQYYSLPPKESRWGTIAAWAWGLQRCVDYLIQDSDIDSEKIAVIGHSRRGKAALLAGAFDERIGIVVPHQSGTGGMALSRNNTEETVANINQRFPHWFSDTFKEFNDQEEKLPFDQHFLIALVAPRPLLDTAGIQDTWVNYESSLRALGATDTVYEFLGAEGQIGDGLLQGEEIQNGDFGELLQYRLDTDHTLNVDYWNAILTFADKFYRRQGNKK